ncbi:antibiotic biosynthesis monooxygenase [Paenibacillus sp. KQZ6P-2]|uniref:Antibiotic biosynthesis monooxygenase n=1 Tax=Paenibacillus mangrovi TaxID=2931978 RepID=A0A9X1WQK3_9BACL|nr:antibiotic biosynthesis monooxygenase [Paenibacillus mangrovi]MCJ8013254.1 antibiotic biosynthesis monooxygenase [Paenibacillus mangrovi]
MDKYAAYVKFTAKAGERDKLTNILMEAANAAQTVKECELYLINLSEKEPDAVWVTEVWSSADAHKASLDQPETRDSIARAMPLIAGVEAIPLNLLGGKGL